MRRAQSTVDLLLSFRKMYRWGALFASLTDWIETSLFLWRRAFVIFSHFQKQYFVLNLFIFKLRWREIDSSISQFFFTKCRISDQKVASFRPHKPIARAANCSHSLLWSSVKWSWKKKMRSSCKRNLWLLPVNLCFLYKICRFRQQMFMN